MRIPTSDHLAERSKDELIELHIRLWKQANQLVNANERMLNAIQKLSTIYNDLSRTSFDVQEIRAILVDAVIGGGG